ncbi:MAG TPA: hypothetical protein VMZ05_07175 [Spirochaetota bacterium]|nr:hypothetical protein [Spirochaetota bacterium]
MSTVYFFPLMAGIRATPSFQERAGISGIANILPFTCMPGTLITSISHSFRLGHGNIPWVNVVYDGQENTGMDTRLQAFMCQAKEYSRRNGLDRPREWKEIQRAWTS